MRHFDAVVTLVCHELRVKPADVLTRDGRQPYLPQKFYAARTVIVIAMQAHIGGCSYSDLALKFGRKHNTLIDWVRQAERFDGTLPSGMTTHAYAADVAARIRSQA